MLSFFYHDDTPFCSFVHVHFSMMERILHGMALSLSYESSLSIQAFQAFPSTEILRSKEPELGVIVTCSIYCRSVPL